MPFEFKLKKTVEFAETDMAGIVHFSNFFRYMEMTEHAFYRSLGFHIHSKETVPEYGMARVEAQCRFLHPVKFQDELEITLLLKTKREKSLSHVFVLRKIVDGAPEKIVAKGAMTVVCIGIDKKSGTLGALPIPPHIAEQIELAPPEMIPGIDHRGDQSTVTAV